jgi:hypothetical protein
MGFSRTRLLVLPLLSLQILLGACSRAGFRFGPDSGFSDSRGEEGSVTDTLRDGPHDAALYDLARDTPQTRDIAQDGAHGQCPLGYLYVPRNPDYVRSSFCVMKYEARESPSGSVAISIPSDLPWRDLNRASAIAGCQANGPLYDLVTNDEWQTIARNIELVAQNWREGVAGGVASGNGGSNSNMLNRGHSDGAPNQVLAASTVDAWGCFGTGQQTDPNGACPLTWTDQKRTHRLSTGEIIWDFGGNLWEWVKDDNAHLYGPDSDIAHIDDVTHANAYALRRHDHHTSTRKSSVWPDRRLSRSRQCARWAGASHFQFT